MARCPPGALGCPDPLRGTWAGSASQPPPLVEMGREGRARVTGPVRGKPRRPPGGAGAPVRWANPAVQTPLPWGVGGRESPQQHHRTLGAPQLTG